VRAGLLADLVIVPEDPLANLKVLYGNGRRAPERGTGKPSAWAASATPSRTASSTTPGSCSPTWRGWWPRKKAERGITRLPQIEFSRPGTLDSAGVSTRSSAGGTADHCATAPATPCRVYRAANPGVRKGRASRRRVYPGDDRLGALRSVQAHPCQQGPDQCPQRPLACQPREASVSRSPGENPRGDLSHHLVTARDRPGETHRPGLPMANGSWPSNATANCLPVSVAEELRARRRRPSPGATQDVPVTFELDADHGPPCPAATVRRAKPAGPRCRRRKNHTVCAAWPRFPRSRRDAPRAPGWRPGPGRQGAALVGGSADRTCTIFDPWSMCSRPAGRPENRISRVLATLSVSLPLAPASR